MSLEARKSLIKALFESDFTAEYKTTDTDYAHPLFLAEEFIPKPMGVNEGF